MSDRDIRHQLMNRDLVLGRRLFQHARRQSESLFDTSKLRLEFNTLKIKLPLMLLRLIVAGEQSFGFNCDAASLRTHSFRSGLLGTSDANFTSRVQDSELRWCYRESAINVLPRCFRLLRSNSKLRASDPGVGILRIDLHEPQHQLLGFVGLPKLRVLQPRQPFPRLNHFRQVVNRRLKCFRRCIVIAQIFMTEPCLVIEQSLFRIRLLQHFHV